MVEERKARDDQVHFRKKASMECIIAPGIGVWDNAKQDVNVHDST